MLICFGVRPEISIFGAIAFTLSTYMIVGINAGHNTRIGSAAFIPLIIAGVHLCFHKKRNLGFIITALSLALQLRLNHLQITYYTLIILIFYGISQLIYFYKKDELKKEENICIKDVFSRGKAIIIQLINGKSIITHNQLYGKWTSHFLNTIIKHKRVLRIEFCTQKTNCKNGKYKLDYILD